MKTVAGICYDTAVFVDLKAIGHNISAMKKFTEKDIMAVVKANAYGHGAIPVARAALEAGAKYLAVAFISEALILRDAGIKAPILILSHVSPENFKLAVNNNLTLTLSSQSALEALTYVSQEEKKPALVHIKINTGLNRLGVQLSEAVNLIKSALNYQKNNLIILEGIFTHLATSEELDKSYANKQLQNFNKIIKNIPHKPRYIHTSNSGGAINLKIPESNIIRLGISMYGTYPSLKLESLYHKQLNLKEALSWHSKITHLKCVSNNTPIGYNKTYKSSKEKTYVATIPVGYADGYNRLLSNNGEVLIKGKRAPIIGRVSMDQITVDVTELMPVRLYDEVVIYGSQLSEKISLWEIAEKLNTIPYELTCIINQRVPRIYI